MQNNPFEQPGRFWKGNLHTHSTHSDGGRSPEDVIDTYVRQGYDFLTISDHFMERYNYPIVDTRRFRNDTFTTLIGAELHAPALENGERWHLLATGLPLDFAPNLDGETGPELARRAVDAGAFLAIAHPNWYSLTLNDALSIDSAHAVEVYNHTANHHNDRGDSWHLTDQLLVSGRKLTTIASDDAHFKDRPDYLGGWIQVRAEAIEPDLLLAALKSGDFYASQGPEFHDIVVTGSHVTIQSSPAQAVFVSGPGSKVQRLRQDLLTEVTFPLELFQGGYFRITIVDHNGKRAWSNPMWLDGSD